MASLSGSAAGGGNNADLSMEERDQIRKSMFKAKEGGYGEGQGERKIISYKDICVGVNGGGNQLDEDEVFVDCFGSDSDESAYWSEEGGRDSGEASSKRTRPYFPSY